MIFNSFDYLLFLPIVFLLYWKVFTKSLALQNSFILVCSYVFYGWWDYRFLSLIIISTVIDYYVGLQIEKSKSKRSKKWYLYTSILANLGLLGVFKYFNFFSSNLEAGLSSLGLDMLAPTLDVVLPVGISFYTFQTLSYSIDVYRGKLKPIKSFSTFAAYVAYFPQLVAGPIERATNLIPQFSSNRTFSYTNSVDGLRQILWGLFKKVVIADNCAEWVNIIFESPEAYNGSTLAVGAILFAFQIYGDFSGYSDIAIGTSKLFGIRLMKNFAFPYFSRDIAEFWRRWHISLSSWFRDYLYIPLGGSQTSKIATIRNVVIIFVVSGFWHGANWTFIFWGGFNALLFMPLLIIGTNRKHINNIENKIAPGILDVLKIFTTFLLVCFAWIFFRSVDITSAFSYISNMFSASLLSLPEYRPLNLIIFILILLAIEWMGKSGEYGFDKLLNSIPRFARIPIYYVFIVIIFVYSGDQQEFIYFRF